jgi:poly(A) polymerase
MQLNHHAILKRADVKSVLEVLNGVRPDCARLVGGCVRDAILGRQVDDVDIATQLSPHDVMAICQAEGLRVVETGIAHGTVTVIVAGTPLEVTTLRKDVATDGRHAEVAFTDDWHEDALRRDFTMNALYCDAQGHVFDPTGQGVDDAKAGLVRFVGDPDARILEDHLRILRYFRFVARYSKGPIEGPELAACARHANAIQRLSVERVWSELKKLLIASDPTSALSAMASAGVLAVTLPEAHGLGLLKNLVQLENNAFLDVDPFQRLMALLPRDVSSVEALSLRLRLSRSETDRLLAWARDETRLVSYLSPREVRQALYWMGNTLFLDRVRLAWAGDPDPKRATQWRTLLAFEHGFQAPKLPLTGDMVMAAGATPGPNVGAVLAEVERWWVANDFIDDELSLIERLKAVVQAIG